MTARLSNSELMQESVLAEDFFYRLGRAAGMAKQAIQKTKAQEIEGIETLSGHGSLSLIVNEKPDAEATVYVGFDKPQFDALLDHLNDIKI
jgi:hypothetical protein